MAILEKSAVWSPEKMGSYPLEDYKKIEFPAEISVRKQGGGFYDLGRFKTVEALEELLKKGLLVGPEQCDRVCYRLK